MTAEVLITPIKNSGCIAEAKTEKKSVLAQFESNEKASQKGTCGYAEQYGGGYSSSNNIAPQIRDVSANIGEKLKKIAIKEGLNLSDTKGYFNFGAGKIIKGSSYTICIPSAFDYVKNVDYRELLVFANDYTIKDYMKSPIIISVEVNIIEVPISANDFINRQKSGAEITNRMFENLSLKEKTAVRMCEQLSGGEIQNTIIILSTETKCFYKISIVFNKLYDNVESVVNRIYNDFQIL